jgi:hypothetical protein
MFVIVNKFHAKFVGMLMICFHTKFHILSSNCPLIFAFKQKRKYRVGAAVMLLFYTQQKKVAYFLQDLITHNIRTPHQVPVMSLPLRSSHYRHVGIIDGRKLRSTNVE